MIIVILAIVLIGLGMTILLLCRNAVGYKPMAGAGLVGIGAMVLIFGVGAYINARVDIKTNIEDKTIERLGIEQNYKQAMQTSDKHRQISAIAKIVTWNNDVLYFKKMSKNPILGDFYPKEVAETLQYIDLESEDLCTD